MLFLVCCLNYYQKLYEEPGPFIWKCMDGPCSIIQPIRLQDFKYKLAVGQ